MNELEREKDALNKKLIEIYESEEFIEGDKKAAQKAERLKGAIDDLEFRTLTPKQQFRELLERQIAEEDENES